MLRIIPTVPNEITEDSVMESEVEKKWYKGKKSRRRLHLHGIL